MSISENDRSIQESGGSESDASSEDGSDYYRPISPVDDNDSSDDDGEQNNDNHVSDSLRSQNPNCSNGYGIDSEDDEEVEDDGDEVDVSESAISRAFREDENRRRAPLSSESAERIMDAMRGISFGGFAPDWVNRVPEDRWIDQLRRMRQSPTTTTIASTTTSSTQI